MPPGNLIDGRAIAEQIHQETARRVAALKARGVQPGLVFVRVGEDPASRVYVGMKEKASARLGISSQTFVLAENTPETELLGLLARLNAEDAVHGILVQTPLPAHICRSQGFRRRRAGEGRGWISSPSTWANCCWARTDGFRPCTPAGIHELLIRSGVDIAGAEAVVLGRGNIVGKPMAAILLQKTQTRRGHRHPLPFPNARHRRALPARGYFDRGHGFAGICQGRHGQTRRGGD